MSRTSKRDTTPADTGSADRRLARLLDSPLLARVVPYLSPETLHQLIQHRGLDACGEIVTSATPAQLTSLLDLDLWRQSQPGRDHEFDVGRFGGLPEVIDEAIKYRIRTPRDGGPTGPVILAGPTCDEVDMLYDKSGYELPLDLAVGDRLEILSAGAYTASYSSVGFNGFPPLREYYI